MLKERKQVKNPNVRSLDTKYLDLPTQQSSEEKFSLNNLQVPNKKVRYYKKIVNVRPSHSSQQSENAPEIPQQVAQQQDNYEFPVMIQPKGSSHHMDSGSENLSKKAFTFYDPNSEKFASGNNDFNFSKDKVVYEKIKKQSVKKFEELTNFPKENTQRHQSMKELGENMEISGGKGHDFFESHLDVEDVNTNYNRYDQHGKPLTISGINNNLLNNISRLNFQNRSASKLSK